MSIAVTCPKCSKTLKVKAEMAGKRGKCPHCQNLILVPAVCSSPAAAQSAAQSGATAGALKKPAPAAARPSPAQLHQQLTAAFRGNIEPIGSSFGYRLGMFAAAIVMVLLPFCYAAFVALVIYLTYLHAKYDTWLFAVSGHGRAAALAFVIYAGGILVGGVMILFLIKPLFARPDQLGPERALTRQDEPLLFAFVDRLCEALGAPRPKRIVVDCQLNASASFRRGIWSMIIGDDLELTIGLPLAAGMTLNQFAAVLAHEFGHFSQGFGMRFCYLIRRVNGWFARVVFERDQWDMRLEHWTMRSGSTELSLVGNLARFGVWCSRRVLFGLMFVGHAVSGYLSRQMEFDADRHAIRLAGSRTSEENWRLLGKLSAAFNGAVADLAQFRRDGKLPDNLPRLLTANAAQMPPEVCKKIEEMSENSVTGQFDTHPCEKDRILFARRENSPGVFHADYPAAVLFADFDGLCRKATWDVYETNFGKEVRPADVHPVESLIEGQKHDEKLGKSLGRFFLGAFSLLRRSMLPKEISREFNPKAIAKIIRQTRETMIEEKDSYKDAYELFDRCDTQIIEAEAAKALFRAKFTIAPDVFSARLTSYNEIAQVLTEAQRKQADLSEQMRTFEEAAAMRVHAALMLLGVPKVAERVPDAAEKLAEAKRLLPALSSLGERLPEMLELRNAKAALNMLLMQIEGNPKNAALFETIGSQLATVAEKIKRLHGLLAAVKYPFDHARGDISTAQYAIDKLPDATDLGAVVEGGEEMFERLGLLISRIIARLTAAAEAVETVLGLEPFPEPPEEKEVVSG